MSVRGCELPATKEVWAQMGGIEVKTGKVAAAVGRGVVSCAVRQNARGGIGRRARTAVWQRPIHTARSTRRVKSRDVDAPRVAQENWPGGLKQRATSEAPVSPVPHADGLRADMTWRGQTRGHCHGWRVARRRRFTGQQLSAVWSRSPAA